MPPNYATVSLLGIVSPIFYFYSRVMVRRRKFNYCWRGFQIPASFPLSSSCCNLPGRASGHRKLAPMPMGDNCLMVTSPLTSGRRVNSCKVSPKISYLPWGKHLTLAQCERKLTFAKYLAKNDDHHRSFANAEYIIINGGDNDDFLLDIYLKIFDFVQNREFHQDQHILSNPTTSAADQFVCGSILLISDGSTASILQNTGNKPNHFLAEWVILISFLVEGESTVLGTIYLFSRSTACNRAH